MDSNLTFDTDFLVIGSGFGGSVSAMRLTEKGYCVIIAEQGKHIAPETMPKQVRDIKQFLWCSPLKYKGFFSIQLFKHVMVLHGNAVGGGSITNANTLLQPADKIWQQGSSAGLHDWQAVMPQYYETAKKMLGVSQNKKIGNADLRLQKMATQMGGIGYGMLSEVFLNIPTTAHCMGGVSLGKSAEDGVVDKYHRLFNYQGFYVCDGSNISTNLGVNPSLTITALAEHAMSHIPHKQAQPSIYSPDTAIKKVTVTDHNDTRLPA